MRMPFAGPNNNGHLIKRRYPPEDAHGALQKQPMQTKTKYDNYS